VKYVVSGFGRTVAVAFAFAIAVLAAQLFAAPRYDLLLRGGHVIDARNSISAVRDVAISGGKIAAVAPKIDPADAVKTVDVNGLVVSPGIVDIHTHVYAGTGEARSYAGDNSVYPDIVAPRSGVTTVVDTGSSGWRNFEDFKQRIIDRASTRVLAFLNIVGHGRRGGKFEQDLADMAAKPTADMARRYPGLVVGIKTAHYSGPEWAPVERAVEAGTLASLPVMVDFGARRNERPLSELVMAKLRPNDIYTHVYSGIRGEQDPSGKVNPALWEARKRGVLFDVGHGATSFAWRIAVPAIKEGFLPDTISTDIHVASLSGGMKDMPNVMSKFLALGMSLDEVIGRRRGMPRVRSARSARASLARRECGVAVWRWRATSGTSTAGVRLSAQRIVRAHVARRQGRLRFERFDRDTVGGSDESNRRKFLTKSTVVAAALALPAAAGAQTTAGQKPVKRVIWPNGKPPEKPPLFSGIVTFGNMVFIAGIGAHFKGDIGAHTKHVLDEIEKRLLSVGSSMDKVLKVNVYLNDLKDYAGMNAAFLGRFGLEPPVRTTIAAAGGIPGDSLVEIDCIAAI
jgi:dihydroorotase